MSDWTVTPKKTTARYPTEPLSTTHESTTPKEFFESKLQEALINEQKGYPKLAQDIYSDLFWNAEVGQESENQASPFKGRSQLSFRFLCIKNACGDGIMNFLIGKIYLEGDSKQDVKQSRQSAMECFRKASEAGYAPAFAFLMQEAKSLCPEANYQLHVLHSKVENEKLFDKKLAMIFLQTAADLGHATAQLETARVFAEKHKAQSESNAFLNAFFCTEDHLTFAIKYYEMAIKQNSMPACSELAQLYATKGTKEDYIKAIGYLQKADDRQALVNLSNTIHDQALVLLSTAGKFNSNEADAKELLLLAAELGLVKAKFEIGKIYESRIASATFISKEHNESQAFKFYKEAADAIPPNLDAAVKVGKIYQGKGKMDDATIYLNIAIQKNSLEAKALMGDKDAAYSHAQSLQKKNPDDLEVLTYYEMAAKWGSTDAQFELGKIYESRIASASIFYQEHNEDKALNYYKQAADGTPAHAEAALKAGKIFQKNGDVDKTGKYFNLAAKMENIEALARLGGKNEAYLHACLLQKINPNDPEVIAFFKIAADKGHGDAAFCLYEMNIEKNRNFQIAYKAAHPEAIRIQSAWKKKTELEALEKQKLLEKQEAEEQRLIQEAKFKKEQELEQQRLAIEEVENNKKAEKLKKIQLELSKQKLSSNPINGDGSLIDDDTDSSQ
jgi:TPR repeat protein